MEPPAQGRSRYNRAMNDEPRRSSLRLWLPALVWMGVIFLFSSRPNWETGLRQDFALKKTAHLFEYGVLALLLYRVLNGSLRRWDFLAARNAWILSVIYAATDEWHQTFVPTRTGHPRDVIIDACGAMLALALLYFRTRKK